MIGLIIYYLVLLGGLATMLVKDLGWIAWGTYFVVMPMGAAALRISQRAARPPDDLVVSRPVLARAGLGALLAGVLVLGLFALLLGVGWARVDSHDISLRGIALGVLGPQFLVALWEEFAFRGAVQPVAVRHWGAVWGLAAASLLFGAFHVPNIVYQDVSPELIPLTVVNLTLMGFVFGWAYQRGGGLALPVALHFGWNSACFAIEEIATYRLTGPPALAGTAAWFPESGLLGMAALAALAAVVSWLTRPGRTIRRHGSGGNHG